MEAERVEAERVEAERVEAERVEAERALAAASEARMQEAVESARQREREILDAERFAIKQAEAAVHRVAQAQALRLARERAVQAKREGRAARAAAKAQQRRERRATEPRHATTEYEAGQPEASEANQPELGVPETGDLDPKVGDESRVALETLFGEDDSAAPDDDVEETASTIEPDDDREEPKDRYLTRALILVAVVLVLGAAAAGGIIYLGKRSTASTNSANDVSGKNSGIASPVLSPLPGTKTLGQYAGTGNTTLDVGRTAVASGRRLIISVGCKGKGPVVVGNASLSTCAAPVNVEADARGITSLPVTADAATKWRIAITDQPDPNTNGGLASPPDSILDSPNAPNVIGVGASAGRAVVTLNRPKVGAPVRDVRIALACTGKGVTFRSTTKAIDGKFTKTCFVGWSYEFDILNVNLPAQFTVNASNDTAWRLVAIAI